MDGIKSNEAEDKVLIDGPHEARESDLWARGEGGLVWLSMMERRAQPNPFLTPVNSS